MSDTTAEDTTETEHNIGRCNRKAPMPDRERCCENYHHCGHLISEDKLVEHYSGYCFTRLTWKCPECGMQNEIEYKVPDYKSKFMREMEKEMKRQMTKDREINRSGTRNPGFKNFGGGRFGNSPFDRSKAFGD